MAEDVEIRNSGLSSPDRLFGKKRSPEEIRRALKSLSRVFDLIWKQRLTLDAEPIPLPGFSSGYGLPVMAGLREFNRGEGYVIGLFEVRRGLVPEDQAIVPIGRIVIGKGDSQLTVITSEIFRDYSEYSVGRKKSSDRYFGLLALEREMAAVSIGFGATYRAKRLGALKRLGLSKDDFLIEGSETWIRMQQLIHTRKGLGTLLLDLTMLIAKKTGEKSIFFWNCNYHSEQLIRNSGYTIIKEEPCFGGDLDPNMDFTLKIFSERTAAH